MLSILKFLNAHNLPIFQPILMILVSKFMVHRALSNKTYLSFGLLSPLKEYFTGELRLSGKHTVTEYEMSGEPYSQKSGWIIHSNERIFQVMTFK